MSTVNSTIALSKLALIAFPTVRYYRDDLVVHDRHTLDNAVPGDVFFWAAVETGTHMIRVRSEGLDCPAALDLHEAVEWGYKLTNWWEIVVDSGGYIFLREVAVDQARAAIAQHQLAGRAKREGR